MKKLVWVVIRVITVVTPLLIAVGAIVQIFIPQAVKDVLYPQVIQGAVIVVVVFLLAQFVLAYRIEDAVARREGAVKEIVKCIGNGEALKTKIADSWSLAIQRQLLEEVIAWEREIEAALTRYYKELISIFRLTGDDPELFFDTSSSTKLELRSRMIVRLKNLSQIVSLLARG